MFTAPPSITTETIFELPVHWHESSMGNVWVEAHLHAREIHSFLAGPCFDTQDNLWITDIPFGRIFRISPAGEWELMVKYEGWPSGLKFHPDGRLIIADHRHGLLALDVDSRKIAPFVTHHLSQRFKGVNDLIFARNGDLYFTDCGQSGLHDPSGGLYCLKAEGALQRLLDNLAGPSGLALSPDGHTLWIAVTHDNAIWRIALAEGGISRVSRSLQFSGGAGPRGIATSDEGDLFVAHHGLGCVWQFNKRGEPAYRIDSSRGDWTSNLAINPSRPGEIFITESQTGCVLKATLPFY